MKIRKELIKFGIDKLTNFYIDFSRFVEFKGIDTITQAWYEMFNDMDYDYIQAEQDFKNSIIDIIKSNNKTPSFSDILDGMRELHQKHELEELRKNK